MVDSGSLIIGLGDQLDRHSSAFDDFDTAEDVVVMAEVAEESTRVWSFKQRIAVFLSAMRLFAESLSIAGVRVDYTCLEGGKAASSLASELALAVQRLKPQRLVMCAPGDWRVYQSIRSVAEQNALPLDVREDRHFFCSVQEFSARRLSMATRTTSRV